MSGAPAFVNPGRPIVIPGHPLVIPGRVPGTTPRTRAAKGPRHKAGDDRMRDDGWQPAELPPHHPAQAA